MSRLRVLLGLVAWAGAALFFFGVHIRLWPGPNECLMTYMHPSYKRYPVPSALDGRYRLVLYKEQRQVPAEHSTAREAGIPVVYVPGNAGSFKQVRSFGSEGYRGFHGASEHDSSLLAGGMSGSVIGELMGLGAEGNKRNSFDFWAVDFREELSGISGVLMEKQSEYLVDAIHHVLSLYNSTFDPRVARARSVVLVAHSMGGVVAMGAAGHSKLRGGAISTVITLATPHFPAVLPDVAMAQRYAFVEQAFRRGAFANVSLVSIGGGGRDVQIPSRLAVPSALAAPDRTLYVDTKSMPRTHLETDHVCIVWCNQVVKAVVGALFNMIDPKTNMIYDSAVARTKAMAKRLSGLVEMSLLSLGEKKMPLPTALSKTEKLETEIRSHSSFTVDGELSLVKNDACIVYNLKATERPLLLTLSRTHARIVARFGGGKLADVSKLLVTTSAMHLDDPRASAFVAVDHLLVRSAARIALPELTQLMVCPNKTTLRTDHYHLCFEGDGNCVAVHSVGHAASRVTVSFDSTNKQSEGATVIATNAADSQMRLVHSVKSGETVSIRFDGSRLDAKVTIVVILPANTTARSVGVSRDVVAMLQDAARPLLPSALVASLIVTCVLVQALGLSLTTVALLGLVGSLAVAGAANVLLPAFEDAFSLAFVSVGSLVVCAFVSAAARLIVAARLFSISRLVFTLFFSALAIAFHFFATVDFVILALLFAVPLVNFQSPERARALVSLLLHSAVCQTMSVVTWVHVAKNSGFQNAMSDAQNVFLLAFVLVQIVLASGFLPQLFSRISLLLIAPLGVGLLLLDQPNAVYLVSWSLFGVGGFAFANASLVSWKDKKD